MDSTGLIDAFRCLRTNESRQHALEALVHELTPYEWRALQSFTSARSFQYDIIGQLPVELVAQIFGYLDTSTPYRLQHVSRQWYHKLRSLEVLKQSLRQWYDDALGLQKDNFTGCEQKARAIHAFRNGIPSSSFEIRPADEIYHPILVDNWLIWKPRPGMGQPRLVYVLNLYTWRLRTVRGHGHEEVRAAFASDQIVGMTTFSNTCYVWTLHGEYSKSFRVPNHYYFESVTCRERSVACAAAADDHIAVYIWDYDSQQGRSFQIDRGPSHLQHLFSNTDPLCKHVGSLDLLLQPSTQTIIMFTDFVCHDPAHPCQCREIPGPIMFSKFSYSGNCLGISHLPHPSGLAGVTLWGQDDDFVATGHKDHVAVRITGCSQKYVRVLAVLHFSEDLNQFIPIDGPSSPATWIEPTTAWWKDSFYGSLPPEQGTATCAMLAHLGTSGVSKLKPLVVEDSMFGLNSNTWFEAIPVSMNEKYVMLNTIKAVHLLCFEDSNTRPKESGSFFDIGKLEILDLV